MRISTWITLSPDVSFIHPYSYEYNNYLATQSPASIRTTYPVRWLGPWCCPHKETTTTRWWQSKWGTTLCRWGLLSFIVGCRCGGSSSGRIHEGGCCCCCKATTTTTRLDSTDSNDDDNRSNWYWNEDKTIIISDNSNINSSDNDTLKDNVWFGTTNIDT